MCGPNFIVNPSKVEEMQEAFALGREMAKLLEDFKENNYKTWDELSKAASFLETAKKHLEETEGDGFFTPSREELKPLISEMESLVRQ